MKNFIIILFLVTLSFHTSLIAQSTTEESKEVEKMQVEPSENQPEVRIFTIVEEMPEFKDGEIVRLQFIYDNLEYPVEAKEEDISGLVVVRMIVEADGSLSNFELKKDIGYGCGEEAIRIMKLTDGMWAPGKQRGEAVSVYYSVPIRFKLDEKTKEELKEKGKKEKKRKKLKRDI